MQTLVGTIVPFQDTSFKIEWDNKNAASDAFIHFKLDVKRTVLSAQLHPFTTQIRTNHAYRDMDFVKVK